MSIFFRKKPHQKCSCACLDGIADTLAEILLVLEEINEKLDGQGASPQLGLALTRVVGRNKVMAQAPPIEIVDVEKVTLSIAPKDEDGRPVPSPNASWSSSDEGVITLQVADDTLSAVAVSGAPGVAVVTVSSGDLSDAIEITVKVGAPQSLNLSAGAPEHE